MKRIMLMVLTVLFVLVLATMVMAEQDIMVWNPRTPAGGGYVPDPSFWLHEALIAKYGERVIQFYAPPITTNYYSGGTLIFGGTTNFLNQDQIDTFAIVGTDFNGTGSITNNIGK